MELRKRQKESDKIFILNVKAFTLLFYRINGHHPHMNFSVKSLLKLFYAIFPIIKKNILKNKNITETVLKMFIFLTAVVTEVFFKFQIITY